MSSELELDLKTTALVLIDLQNGIVANDIRPYSSKEIVARCRSLADAFREKGLPVVFVHVLMHEFLKLPVDQAQQIPKDLPEDASEIVEAAGKQSGDFLITKRHWGAFAGTNLEQELHSRGVKTVVLGGIATNLGVESTLRQGTGLGFGFVTVEDACGTFTPEMQEFAFKTIFPRLSKVRTTAQVLEALA